MDIFLLSLGCSKNQADSEHLAGMLERYGHRIVGESGNADAAIVNTCGFIFPAVEESVDSILELEILKESGLLKKLVVMGCLVNRFGEELKSELRCVDHWAAAGDFSSVADAFSIPSLPTGPVVLPGYSRWSRYLKISEGCNNRCSYCMIPAIRGGLASRPSVDILEEAEFMIGGGAKEICLVGQDLTSYGNDIGPKASLSDLISRIDDRFRYEHVWFRLLYLHPSRVDKLLIEQIASSSVFLNYLDIPIQHVDPVILASMNRGGLDREKLSGIFACARGIDKDFALRTTVIAGYPGETEAQFESMTTFLQEAEIDRVGVFPFYAEEGTRAAVLGGQIPEEIKLQRVERISLIQEEISLRRQKRFEGKILEVLIEEENLNEGYAEGRSFREAPEVDGVLEVHISDKIGPGSFCQVKITGAYEHDLLGEMVRP